MAGLIPQHFIDELVNRVDIVDVIDTRVPLKKAGRDFTACCPFHNEKTPSFTVSPEKQFYHCFGCGAHGTAIGFLMDYEHMEFVDAIETLASQIGLEVPREAGDNQPTRSHQPLYDLMLQCSEHFQHQLREHQQSERAVSYLKQRGLSGEVARDFGIGYAAPGWDNLINALGSSAEQKNLLLEGGMLIKRDDGSGLYDRFRDRIMFPIRDRRGRTIAFGGRILGDEKPKYLNSPETPVFHKGQELYGLYEARQAVRNLERLLVVEGYMDVVALAQFDIRYAVATLGTSTTKEHLERMYRVVPEVVFCFDGDRAGREAAWRALENALPVMQEGREARFLFLPDGEDPDTLIRQEGKEAFEVRISNALNLSDYLYDKLLQEVDMKRVEGRARLVEIAKPLLAKLPKGVFHHLMQERLARLSGIDSAQLASMIGGESGSGPQRRTETKIRPKADRGGNQSPSMVRHAITLLLLRPELANQVGDQTGLEQIDMAGIPLLQELIGVVQSGGVSSTAAILERWRDRPEGRHLNKLASTPLDLPEAGAEQEFLDTLQGLKRQYADQRREALLYKQRDQELSGDEKNELQQLFREKAARHK
ncbi:DNA primase [Solemya pervernicosa gill symbiont]|uniref:DNA primase n=2 Tax=Gammaproteobacteria incertae sedis TaxID=118884 RepID=A0A1T2L419_9GAMM|nr:DNA primase [Candidatus Reidiella endopervernicosa]OOZ39686.1 DNA primase [Solemya pervernicosa gill symbiont]QKQ24979.1 DNA primase [Candidatus Reidiella endopervernicosa]